MAGGIKSVSDILPHSFYTQVGPDARDAALTYQYIGEQSTIGRSAAEVARDPANLTGALHLPLLSYDDYRRFLLQGRSWFESITGGGGKGELAPEVRDRQHEIIIGMLDGWHDALQRDREAARAKEAQQKQQPSPLERLIEFELSRARQLGPQAIQETSMRVAALMIVSSQVGVQGSHAIAVTGSIGGAWNVVQPLLSAEVAPHAGLAVSYYSAVTQTQLALLTPAILRELAVEGKGMNSKMAKAHGYCMLLLQNIFSEKFDQQLAAQIRATGGEARNYDPEKMGQVIAAIKLALLMNAMALLYKAETGGLTSIEVGDMVLGRMELQEGTMMQVLVSLVRAYLPAIPGEQREKLIEGILAYFDSDPRVEDLLDVSHSFEGILGTSTGEHLLHQAA